MSLITEIPTVLGPFGDALRALPEHSASGPNSPSYAGAQLYDRYGLLLTVEDILACTGDELVVGAEGAPLTYAEGLAMLHRLRRTPIGVLTQADLPPIRRLVVHGSSIFQTRALTFAIHSSGLAVEDLTVTVASPGDAAPVSALLGARVFGPGGKVVCAEIPVADVENLKEALVDEGTPKYQSPCLLEVRLPPADLDAVATDAGVMKTWEVAQVGGRRILRRRA